MNAVDSSFPVLVTSVTVHSGSRCWPTLIFSYAIQAGARDEAPRNLLAEVVNLKSNQLKGAADQLRQRAKRLRQTTVVQQVFQQGVVHLRKNWRIIAPNHGKVRYSGLRCRLFRWIFVSVGESCVMRALRI